MHIEKYKKDDSSILKKRYEYLQKRIGMSDKDLSYDKAEAGALRRVIWLLEQLEKKPWLKKDIYED